MRWMPGVILWVGYSENAGGASGRGRFQLAAVDGPEARQWLEVFERDQDAQGEADGAAAQEKGEGQAEDFEESGQGEPGGSGRGEDGTLLGRGADGQDSDGDENG